MDHDGFCACGCGGKTSITQKNYAKKGWIKGQPKKYILGHWPRGKKGPDCHNWKSPEEYATFIGTHGYRMVLIHGHHRANIRGYVREHIVVVEKLLGRPFIFPNVIHHHTPEQLVICENQAYHMLLHQRTKAYNDSGHANWILCIHCKQFDDPHNMYIRKNHNGGYHRKCHAEYNLKRYYAKNKG